ncbi:hypothetical protein BWR15_15470 [Pseudomonas sp. T]|nr:hypothetical protein BWR15_15470 [Pseudomonas sp. T]
MFFEAFAGAGSAMLVVGFLSKWLVELWAKRILQEDSARINIALEQEKSALQVHVETIKSSLLSRANIIESRFNSINQERLNAISENYKLLADTWLHCRRAIQPDELGREKPPIEELLADAVKSLNDYFRDFERKKIFLSEKSQEEVYGFLACTWGALNKLRIFTESSQPFESKVGSLYDAWINDLKPQMDAARKSIEMEYKVLIGVADQGGEL